MNEKEALIFLNMTGAIGGIRLKKLTDVFAAPQDILKAPFERLRRVEGIGDTIASLICSLKSKDLDRELALIEKYNLKIITWLESDYPENLKDIPDPAPVLYLKGDLKPQDKFAMAIVGSRRASFYGLSSAEKLASELGAFGFTIVSGLARGIDAAAHRGCLKAGGRTIAVIGSGFADIYPVENKDLAEEVAGSGAVISEFAISTPPKRENFPRRNRIISGLSLGTLVAEAARNSGALITADFALEQGREVFALPGKVDAQNSYGTNALIKQGAKLVSCVDDILEEFGLVSQRQETQKAAVSRGPFTQEISDKEANALYECIQSEPVTLDDIIEKTNMTIPRVSEIILNLRLKKLIKLLPGEQFVRN